MLFALLLALAPAAHAWPDPAKVAATLEGVLNLNTATPEQLELLPGVGPKKIAAILAHRQKRPFKTTAELMRVKGIGPKSFRVLKPFLAVTGETTLARVKGKARQTEPPPAPQTPSDGASATLPETPGMTWATP